MGHLINPTAFRLHFFNNWLDCWAITQFKHYGEILHNIFQGKKILAYFLENMITDRFGILYSHMSINEDLFKIKVNTYFYDGLIEKKIQKLISLIKKFNWKRNKINFRLKYKFKFYHSTSIKQKLLTKWSFYNYLIVRKVVFLFIFFFNFTQKNIKYNLKKKMHKLYFKTFLNFWKKSSIFFRKILLKKGFLNKVNLRFPIYDVISITKSYFWFFKKVFFKKIIRKHKLSFYRQKPNFEFFLILFEKIYTYWILRFNYLQLLFFYNKLSFTSNYSKYINNLRQTNDFLILFALTIFRIYLINFRQRIFFKIYFFILKPLVQRIFSLPVLLEFYGIDNDLITSYFLSRFLTRKIEMNFSLKELFKPISKELKIVKYTTFFIKGFKLQFLGRIKRKDRARISWTLFGSVPFSTVTSYVEHSLYIGILKNGTCCLRVWFQRPPFLGNHNTLYKYIIHENILKRIICAKRNNQIFLKKRKTLFISYKT